MAARITTSPEVSVARRDTLFTGTRGQPSPTAANFDVFPDGQRFVMVNSPGGTRLIGVANWTQVILRRERESTRR